MLPITCHWQSRFREIRWWGNFKRSSCRSDCSYAHSERHFGIFGTQTCGILLFRTRAESSFGEQKVKDSDRLELDWLLKCKLEELIASVRCLLRIVSKSSGPFSIALADQVSSSYCWPCRDHERRSSYHRRIFFEVPKS